MGWSLGLGSLPLSGALHEPQIIGLIMCVSLTSSGGAGGRRLPLCPGWPPRFFPLGGRLEPPPFFQGASLDCGLLEVRDVLRS